MVFEVATIEIKAGAEQDFESGVFEAVTIFRSAQGCRSMTLERSVEFPSRYRLVVGWETIEDHTERFRESPGFQAWRSMVAHTFAGSPTVEHTSVVLEGF